MVACEAPSEKWTGLSAAPVASLIWAMAKCSPPCCPVVVAVIVFAGVAGPPLYLAALWVTWLMVRAVPESKEQGDTPASA